MNIKDAEKLVCPFIQQLNVGTGYQMYGECSNIFCITKDCMAWEFDDIPISKPDKFGRYKTKKSEDSGFCKRLK